ncbi:hypothetical protein STENM327S_09057 [Streptomyces tendae]
MLTRTVVGVPGAGELLMGAALVCLERSAGWPVGGTPAYGGRGWCSPKAERAERAEREGLRD